MTYTHADHAKACQQAAKRREMCSRKPVQVRKRGIVYCAVIVEAYTTPDGLDCWTVESTIPEAARFTVACKNVIECCLSDCTCCGSSSAVSGAGFDGFLTPAFGQAGVVAPPDSLNFENFDHAGVAGFGGRS